MAQVVECLHNKHNALSSNPSTEKKKKLWKKTSNWEYFINYFIFFSLFFKGREIYYHLKL
jgi:hypothetical protein